MTTATVSARKTVGIYCTLYPQASTAFIDEQVRNLPSYTPVFLLRTRGGPLELPNIAMSDRDPLRIRQRLFALTRLPALFGRLDRYGKPDLIHAHFGNDSIYALALAKKLQVPLLVTFHGADITLSPAALLRSGKASSYYYLLMRGQLKTEASAFIAVSRFIEKRLLAAGYPAERVIQHYIGVDTAKFAPALSRPEQRYILCVARHVEKKGIAVLLRAFARIENKHKSVSLLQVGAGPLSAHLEQLTVALGLQNRVHFLGKRTHSEVVALMRNAEIFALPSQTAIDGDSEALGIVFNEASACGVPVVSTFHGGIPEVVLDGETGFLVKEGDDRALAERLDLLLTDRSLAARFGARGRQMVCDCFDIRQQSKQLAQIYDQVLSAHLARNQA